ncbi:MAG: AAA family ATPase [Candidatus Omnitrophota bacterium]|nr:MAG: AAA family ATPase [Candidatus Omnitrophota bacterium]
MHLKEIRFHPDDYPTQRFYPFNHTLFHRTEKISLDSIVTIFVGENGSGKTTLLEAISRKCGIHIWQNAPRPRIDNNPYEYLLYRYLEMKWSNGSVPGSYFGSDIFKDFTRILDEWAVSDPGQLKYFGGKSLLTQSHGQSILSFFKARYKIKGLYLLDEPETALSPKSQLELLDLLADLSQAGHAQFIMATHSPLLMACTNATILNFDAEQIRPISYENTEHFQIYKRFFDDTRRSVLPGQSR